MRSCCTRTAAVHELWPPGYGMEGMTNEETVPYYHQYGFPQAEWALVHPVGFFATIAQRCPAKLKLYLECEDLDSYTRVRIRAVLARLVGRLLVASGRPWSPGIKRSQDCKLWGFQAESGGEGYFSGRLEV